MNASEITVNLSVSVDRAAIDAAADSFSKAVEGAVTVKTEESKPLVCIGCGAVRNPDGQMPCDH